MSSCKIPGEFDFEEITSAINGEEAYGYIFVKSVPTDDCNEAEFIDTDDGSSPTSCLVLPEKDPRPEGYKKQWHGMMICGGHRCMVNLWREEE